MVGRKKLLIYFIEDIPDAKLTGFPSSGTVFSDANFRLDVQGVSTVFSIMFALHAEILILPFPDNEQRRMESPGPGQCKAKEEFTRQICAENCGRASFSPQRRSVDCGRDKGKAKGDN